MKISKNFGLWIVLFLLFNGCMLHFDSSTADQLQGTWRLSDVTSLIANSNNSKTFEEQAQEKQLVKEGMIYNFFENRSFTEVRKEGTFITGQWEYYNDDNSQIILYSGKAKASHTIKIGKNQFGRQEMKLDDSDQNKELSFIKEATAIKDFKSDPFYPENNHWRIKPSGSETETELTNRLKAYLKHIALILKAAKERNQEIVSFEFSMGPIKIYNGGIGVYSYSIVPDSWKACFYNDSDALRAYNIYNESISTHSYHGAGTGNWVEDDYNILLSIYADLKERKNNEQGDK
jgi:hypothetical protein